VTGSVSADRQRSHAGVASGLEDVRRAIVSWTAMS